MDQARNFMMIVGELRLEIILLFMAPLTNYHLPRSSFKGTFLVFSWRHSFLVFSFKEETKLMFEIVV
jgi:hypothetical protein